LENAGRSYLHEEQLLTGWGRKAPHYEGMTRTKEEFLAWLLTYCRLTRGDIRYVNTVLTKAAAGSITPAQAATIDKIIVKHKKQIAEGAWSGDPVLLAWATTIKQTISRPYLEFIPSTVAGDPAVICFYAPYRQPITERIVSYLLSSDDLKHQYHADKYGWEIQVTSRLFSHLRTLSNFAEKFGSTPEWGPNMKAWLDIVSSHRIEDWYPSLRSINGTWFLSNATPSLLAHIRPQEQTFRSALLAEASSVIVDKSVADTFKPTLQRFFSCSGEKCVHMVPYDPNTKRYTTPFSSLGEMLATFDDFINAYAPKSVIFVVPTNTTLDVTPMLNLVRGHSDIKFYVRDTQDTGLFYNAPNVEILDRRRPLVKLAKMDHIDLFISQRWLHTRSMLHQVDLDAGSLTDVVENTVHLLPNVMVKI